MWIAEIDIEEAYQKKFGGVKRKDLKPNQYLFPERKAYPVTNEKDALDALRSFGRGDNNMSYIEFIKKLISFCKKQRNKSKLAS